MDEVIAQEATVETPAATTETEVSSPSETSRPSTTRAPDHGKLESSIGKKFSDVFKDAGEDDEVVETLPAATVKDPATGEEKPATEETTETADAGEQEAETPTTPAKVNPATPIIPAAYRRSLKAYQWTDEEIDSAMKADPANFLRTAAKFHENRNEETRRMSQMGQLAKQQQDAQQVNTPAPATLPAKFDLVDVEALKKTYGKDEAIIKQMEQINKVVAFANTLLPWFQQSQANQKQAELTTLGKQVDGFFSGKDLADYAEVYGTDAAKLKPEQMTSRQKVLETADLLIRGSRSSGRTLTLEDALTMAHDSVSGPVKTQAIRKTIVDAAKTRNAAISLRPGAKTSPNRDKDSRKALESGVGKGLAAAFK